MKKQNKLVDQVLEFILTCDLKDLSELTVERIAGKYDISPSFLMRQIKRHKSFTLGDFITKEKMIRASSMLERDDISIKDISRKLGFSTHGYFIQVFKKFFGTVPRRYRECKREQNDCSNRQGSPKSTEAKCRSFSEGNHFTSGSR